MDLRSTDIRRSNRTRLLRYLFTAGTASQPELAHQLGLSQPTVMQYVQDLLALGLIRESGIAASTGGRKARCYAPVYDARFVLGIDISPDAIRGVRTDLAGTVLCETSVDHTFSFTDSFLAALRSVIQTLIGDIPIERLCGAGAALPGIISTDSALVRGIQPGSTPIQTAALARMFPCPVSFLRTAQAEALYTGSTDAVYLSLGRSVDGAVLQAGQLMTGTDAPAGLFGHMTLIPGGRKCLCGRSGCAETYLSLGRLTERTDGDAGRFFTAVREGGKKSRAALDEYLDLLAVLVHNLRTASGMPVIVGGTAMRYLAAYEMPLRMKLAALEPENPDTTYMQLISEDPCAPEGAARLSTASFFSSLS